MSIQASRNNAISLQVAIEEYFRDNNLDEEITDYSFGNGAFTEWNFYCDGDDFKYIDDDVLYDYIADLREFRDENFEVFSFRDEISVKILDDDYEESKKSARKSMRESINVNSILSKVEAIVSKTKIKHPKAEIIELDGTKYIYYSYFDRGFDDNGLDMVWDKCSDLKGVVDVGFGYGYGLENTKYEDSLLIELDDDVIAESKKSARKSLKEAKNGYYIYTKLDNKYAYCDKSKFTEEGFYLIEDYMLDAIHIFKTEKEAEKFIDEDLNRFMVKKDNVVIDEYPSTKGGFFESKESARKSIKESYLDEVTNLYFFDLDVDEECEVQLENFVMPCRISQFYKNDKHMYLIVQSKTSDETYFVITYNYKKNKFVSSKVFSSYREAKNQLVDTIAMAF